MTWFGWLMLGFSIVNAVAWGMFVWNLFDIVPKFLSKISGSQSNIYIRSNNTQVNTKDGTIKVSQDADGPRAS